MRLVDYIHQNHGGNNAAFARANGISKQFVGIMLNKGTYYVFDGMLMIAKRELKQGEE